MAWESPYNLLKEELVQRRDEGCVVPAAILQPFQALDPVRDAWSFAAIDPLYDALMEVPCDPVLLAREPSELDAIRALRPDGPRDFRWAPPEGELLDRLHGAWTGRSVGCALGKPVEGMGMTVEGGRLAGRARIRRYLENRGDWPLRDYWSGREIGDGLRIGCPASQRERIAYMEPDDDIHYTLTALGVMERFGPDFTWENVAQFWLSHIPLFDICTAEAQAVMNVLGASTQGWRWTTVATPAFTRRNRNPYREWIGAQIRADGWGWMCAGKPELAAELAYRDASWTHERNGIYGEMMFAAMQAAAFVVHDPRSLVTIGLSEIPRDCRLARQVSECLTWIEEAPDFETCMAKVEAALPAMSPVHTINNALVCILSLAFGKMDTTASIATSVMCGLDTDCNGATVGSIVGAAAGRAKFRPELAERLRDTIRPSMVGFAEVKMEDLARRTLAQWKRVEAHHRAV